MKGTADHPPAKAPVRHTGAQTGAMSSIAAVLPGAMRKGAQVCRRCGHQITFGPQQWRRTCGRCGLVITLPPPLVVERQHGVRQPDCFLCADRGLVFYQAQQGQMVYDFVARCNCRAGKQRRETALPRVDQVDNICDLNYLERMNRQAWEKRTGQRARPTLLENAVAIPAVEIPF